jgi:hypothetical protein
VTFDHASMLALWVVVLVNLGLTVRLVAWSRVVTRADDTREGFGPELTIGQRSPTFRARSITGERVTERTFAGSPTTYVFVSPNCESCRSTVSKLQPFAVAALRQGTRVVVVSDSGTKRTGAWLDEIRNDGTAVVAPVLTAPREDSSMLEDYDGPGFLPYFCRVSPDGAVQARGIVGRDDWLALTRSWAGHVAPPPAETGSDHHTPGHHGAVSVDDR